MSLPASFEQYKGDVRRDLRTAIEAERADDPIQNGNQRAVDVSKNTHFEYQFESEGREAYGYVERLHEDTGIELMLWVDTSWFTDDELESLDYATDIGDIDDELGALATAFSGLVADELGRERVEEFVFTQMAPPSAVFQVLYYMD
jgi:hypothetical protein